MFSRRKIKNLYSFKATPFDLKGPFIVVSSHITDADQYLIMQSFKSYIYFAYDEKVFRTNPDIAKWQKFFGNMPYKLASPLIEHKDKILKYVNDGNNLCLFPELYTNYSGITSPIEDTIGEIVKEANCTLVTYCFTGGYLTEPAWAKHKRKGWLNGHIVNVYSSYDLDRLLPNQVSQLIADDLKEDAYARQCNSPITYDGEGFAEGLENVFYLCPNCGAKDSYEASGNDYHCTKCDARGSYTNQGIIHANFRFKTITDFLAWEETQIDRIADSEINFEEEGITLSIINDKHEIQDICTENMRVDKNGIFLGEHTFLFEDIKKADVEDGGTSLVFSHGNEYYKMTKPGFRPLRYRKLIYKRKYAIATYGNGPK